MALMEFFRRKRNGRYPERVSELPEDVQAWLADRSSGRSAEELDAAAEAALAGHEDEMKTALAWSDAMRAQRRRDRR
jgi:hypothetical protein